MRLIWIGLLALPALLATGVSTAGAAGAAAAAETPQARLDRLAWLAGTWQGTTDGVRMEETWSTPDGGGLVGMHKDSRGGRMVSFEFFRVVPQDEGRICYLASPLGRAPVPFCALSLGDSAVVFENAEHDFPQRVLYRLLPDGRLHARIEGLQGGKPAAEEWWWTRSGGR